MGSLAPVLSPLDEPTKYVYGASGARPLTHVPPFDEYLCKYLTNATAAE